VISKNLLSNPLYSVNMKWNLGIISDEISQDFEHSLKVISELGAHYVEIRNLWNKNVVSLSESEISEMKNLVTKYNLQISNLDLFTFKTYINNEKEYREHLNVFKKVIKELKPRPLRQGKCF